MHLKEFQERARTTDQTRREGTDSDPKTPTRHEVVPLLGLVGEVGGLLGEYKKRLRDGETHRSFPEDVAEELGDILWYVANVADKFGLDLEAIAADNLRKVSNRWLRTEGRRRLYDEELPIRQRLPRTFEYRFEERLLRGVSKVVMVDVLRGVDTGNPLTDNAYDDRRVPLPRRDAFGVRRAAWVVARAPETAEERQGDRAPNASRGGRCRGQRTGTGGGGGDCGSSIRLRLGAWIPSRH